MSRYYSSILNVLSPSFANTYSLAFDGVDDFLDITPSYTLSGEFGISVWFKNDVLGNDGMLLGKGVSGTNSLVWLNSTTRIYVNVGGSTATFNNDGTNPIPTSGSSWANLLIWRDNTDTVHCYLNNQNFGTLSIINPTQTNDFTFDRIGGAAATYFWNGNIDEVSIYNTALSLTDRNTIYGTGNPSDISSISGLIAWYRNGDNGSYKSPQWLIPENSNKDKVSNYSFEYDGVDDEIFLSSSFVAAGEFTLSLWIKPTVLDSNQNILGNSSSSQNWINPSSATTIRVKPAGTLLNFLETGGNNLTVGSWNHILIYRDSSNNIGIFVNGATFSSTQNNSNTLTLQTIGRGVNKWFSGNIDEVAFWNADKSSDVATIYSSGTPADLSSLSPVGYWRSENSTFSTNWTVTDNGSGSNDGLSANMTIEDRVGDASSSSNNAVSFNMTESDREADVPS